MLLDKLNRLAHHVQRAQTQQIDLDQPRIFDIVFIPLRHDTPGHRGPLERSDLDQRSRGDNHAAHMDGEVARHTLDLVDEGRVVIPGQSVAVAPQFVCQACEIGAVQ